MNLSFKDTKFIILAIDNLIEKFQERYDQIEDVDEDESSDLGNDIMFLNSLRKKLEKSIRRDSPPQEKPFSENTNPELDKLKKEENSLLNYNDDDELSELIRQMPDFERAKYIFRLGHILALSNAYIPYLESSLSSESHPIDLSLDTKDLPTKLNDRLAQYWQSICVKFGLVENQYTSLNEDNSLARLIQPASQLSIPERAYLAYVITESILQEKEVDSYLK